MRCHRTAFRRHFSSRFRSWLLCVLIGHIVVLDARAHRPNESTAQLRWEHQRLEAELVLSIPLASLVLGDPGVPLITSENFPAIRDRLRLRLIETFRIEAGSRVVAPLASLGTASLADDGDVKCSLVFPLDTPSPLRVHAAFLQSASPDSFCWIRLWSGDDRLIAQKLLVRGSSRADLPANASESAPPAVTPAATP